MQVTSLAVYPVKSLGGVAVEHAEVAEHGPVGDRRWAVLDPDGHKVTARECHAMLRIRAEPTPHGVRLVDGDDAIAVATPGADAERVPTHVKRVETLAHAGEGVDAWLSERLGRSLRLVHQTEPVRTIAAKHGGRPGETMSLADAGPVLLVTESSLDRMRDLVAETSGEEWLSRSEAARRFRPNVVVDGEEPFAEDGWQRIRIGEVTYRQTELCDRCVLTTIDLGTFTTGKEPIRTLARHRRWDGTTWFGVRYAPESGGRIAVGDEVQVLERAAASSSSM